MRRRYQRILVGLLVLVVTASMSPMQFGAGTLRIDSYRVMGPTIQVTVTNVTGAPQSAFLVIVAELGSLTEISVQPITVAGGGTISKATVFPDGITRIIHIGISEGPDPVTNIAR